MFKEQELILAQEVANLAIWEWCARTDEVRWLPGSVALFGRPPEQMPNREAVFACIAQEDRERVQRELEAALSGVGDFDAEFRVQWPNAETHWLAVHGRLFHDPERGRMVLGVCRDITESKLREQVLASQAKLLELAYEPILVRDAQDAITFWNSGAERLYGFTRQEAIGQPTHELLSSRFPEPLPQIEHRLATTGSWEGELVHRTKDGRLVHVASRWQRFSDGGTFTLETNFDLSEVKALQIAKVWEEKSKLIGELSHQINNPLEAAAGALYILRSGCEAGVQQYADVLENSIHRIAEFIRKSNELHQSAQGDERRLQHELEAIIPP